MPCLVNYLDFSPINRGLATALAKRFVRTVGLADHRQIACLELKERFFSWLTPKTQRCENRPQNHKMSGAAFTSDLRLIGLIDQYRASGTRPSRECPLFRVAFFDDA